MPQLGQSDSPRRSRSSVIDAWSAQQDAIWDAPALVIGVDAPITKMRTGRSLRRDANVDSSASTGVTDDQRGCTTRP